MATACQKAICQRNWVLLLECQDAIKKLQPFITTVTPEVRKGWKQSPIDRTAKETELRAMILELEELVESNKKLLQAAQAVALDKREQLGQAGRNLKRLQSSYGSARRPALRGVA
ncbi:MAG TPA: hypothetical protein VGJ73_17470 [Verrucomicrobiae bacterium]